MARNDFSPALSNMGALIALSALNTDPTVADIIGELDTVTGLSLSVNDIDTTSPSSTTDIARFTPTYKVWGEATITLFKNNANFKKVFNQFFGYNTFESGFYCDMTFHWPKLSDWIDVHDIKLHGYLSGFSFGDINKDDVQKISFKFKPSGNPEIFSGFDSITGLTASPTSLTAAGGNVEFTVAGTNLNDGLLVKGFVNGEAQPLTVGYTSGTDTAQTVTVAYPPNSGSSAVEYTVKVSKDGGITYDTHTATVTVAAPTE